MDNDNNLFPVSKAYDVLNYFSYSSQMYSRQILQLERQPTLLC